MNIQQFVEAHLAAVSSLCTWVVLFAGTLLARYKIPPNNWVLIVLRAVLGAIVDQLHPADFKQAAVAARTVRVAKKSQAAKVTVGSLVCLLLLFSCSGDLQKKLNTVLVFEQQAQGYEQQLVLAGQAAIAALPADKQADAMAKLVAASDAVTVAYAAKDKALQDAIAQASVGQLNLGQLTADVVSATEALLAILRVFGVPEAKLTGAKTSIEASHVQVKAVLAQ